MLRESANASARVGTSTSAAPSPSTSAARSRFARPRDEVATYAADPENATAWYENIDRVAWRTSPPLAVGSRVAFVARFLGRRLSYTYEISEFVPEERLVMRTADGPFPMETTYEWTDARSGTRMVLRNRGEPSGFAKVARPMMERAMRRANAKDLARLKEILEADAATGRDRARMS